MDQRMPRTSGLEAARRILAEDPDQAVVVLTAFPDKQVQAAAERLGVRGWMSKNDMRLLPALLRVIHRPR
jgi:DNA-binding NarL/FixJ family response regulator